MIQLRHPLYRKPSLIAQVGLSFGPQRIVGISSSSTYVLCGCYLCMYQPPPTPASPKTRKVLLMDRTMSHLSFYL